MRPPNEAGEVFAEIAEGEGARRERSQIGRRERAEPVFAEDVRERAKVLAQDVDVPEEELLAVDLELHDGREALVSRSDLLGQHHALGAGGHRCCCTEDVGQRTLDLREAHVPLPARTSARMARARSASRASTSQAGIASSHSTSVATAPQRPTARR